MTCQYNLSTTSGASLKTLSIVFDSNTYSINNTNYINTVLPSLSIPYQLILINCYLRMYVRYCVISISPIKKYALQMPAYIFANTTIFGILTYTLVCEYNHIHVHYVIYIGYQHPFVNVFFLHLNTKH